MFGTSVVTTKGQVTIPQDLRLMLGISPGDRLYFEGDLQTKTARVKKASQSVVDELAGSLKSPFGYVPISIARQKAGEALAKKYGLSK